MHVLPHRLTNWLENYEPESVKGLAPTCSFRFNLLHKCPQRNCAGGILALNNPSRWCQQQILFIEVPYSAETTCQDFILVLVRRGPLDHPWRRQWFQMPLSRTEAGR